MMSPLGSSAVVSYHEIIKRNYRQLVDSIDLNGVLLNRMLLIEPLDTFCPHCSDFDKRPKEVSGSLLHFLRGLETSELVDVMMEFVVALVEEGQEHVANLLTGRTDGKQPMSEKHFNTLRRHLCELQQFLDPSKIFLAALGSADVFVESDKYRVTGKTTCSDKADEVVRIMMRKSDCAFGKFKQVLILTSQDHVVYILTDGREGIPPLSDEHSTALKKKRELIVQAIYSKFDLLDAMVSNGSLTMSDKEYVESKHTENERSGAILDKIMRKSEEAFNGFLQALDSTCHEHVTCCIRDGLVLAVDVTAVDSSPVDSAPTHQPSTRIMDTVETEVQQQLLSQTKNPQSEVCTLLAANSIPNPELVRNCIKLLFKLPTRDSLDKLLHLIDSGRLEETLTATCQDILTKHDLKKIKLQVDQGEVDKCRRQIVACTLMTTVHREALKSVVDELCQLKVSVNKELLSHLSLGDKRQQYVLSNKSETERVEVLLEITSRRPDHAFDELVNALRATGQRRAADVLERASLKEDDGDRRTHGRETAPSKSTSASNGVKVPLKRYLPKKPIRVEIYNRTTRNVVDDSRKCSSLETRARDVETIASEFCDRLQDMQLHWTTVTDNTFQQLNNTQASYVDRLEQVMKRNAQQMEEVHEKYRDRIEKMQKQHTNELVELSRKHSLELQKYEQLKQETDNQIRTLENMIQQLQQRVQDGEKIIQREELVTTIIAADRSSKQSKVEFNPFESQCLNAYDGQFFGTIIGSNNKLSGKNTMILQQFTRTRQTHSSPSKWVTEHQYYGIEGNLMPDKLDSVPAITY